MRNTLDPRGNAGLVQILNDPVGDRADMTLRAARRHDHVIADRRFIPQIDGESVLRLHIVEAGEDHTKDLLGVRTHSGDRLGRATFGPKSYRCGQGSLSFRSIFRLRIESGTDTKIGMRS
jgi:hypothetical protein